MRFKIKEPIDESQWHKFFVIWPRIVEGHWVAFETVERRFHFDEDEYRTYMWPEYRLYNPPEPQSNDWDDYSLL